MDKPTVLITTAIRPPDGMPMLAMTNRAERLIATKAAIFFWAAQGMANLVIADATDSEVLSESEMDLLKQKHIAIEQLRYSQDAAPVREFGKGFAEGKLIEFALERSSLLQSHAHFYKCTGKVFCRNFQNINENISQNHITGFFWKFIRRDGSLTGTDLRFYYTSKYFFKEHLSKIYALSNDRKNSNTEHLAELALNEILPQGLATRPLLTGFEGGIGKPYPEFALGDLEHIFPCWYLK